MCPEENQHHQCAGFNTYKTSGRQIQVPSDQFEGASSFSLGFPSGASGKELSCQCRRHKRLSSIPGSGRSPGVGNATKRNPVDREAWWATVPRAAKSQTPLKRLSTHASPLAVEFQVDLCSQFLCLSLCTPISRFHTSVSHFSITYLLTGENQGRVRIQLVLNLWNPQKNFTHSSFSCKRRKQTMKNHLPNVFMFRHRNGAHYIRSS